MISALEWVRKRSLSCRSVSLMRRPSSSKACACAVINVAVVASPGSRTVWACAAVNAAAAIAGMPFGQAWCSRR
jgi:hypothetical protein